MDAIDHTIKALRMNTLWIWFFSVPFLLSFVILMLSPMPTYVAVGGAFLRTGSIPDMSPLELGLVIVASVVSLLLLSVAVVCINIVIKHNRTLTKIPKEVVEGIEAYTFSVFWLLLTAQIFYFVVYLISYEYGAQEIIGPLATLIFSLGLFYAPAAIVIDERRPFRAVQSSFQHIARKPHLFLVWIAIAFIGLVALDAFFIALKGYIPFARFFVLIINSFVLLPFLTVFQTQIFLTKYSILK